MDGPGLLTYLRRRLKLEGISIEAASEEEATLYDALTEGRDTLVELFAQRAPVLVREYVTLELVPGSTTRYQLPAASRDPLKVLTVRDVTCRQPLTPAAEGLLEEGDGEYEWLSPRILQVREGISPSGGLEIWTVLQRVDITDATTEALVGLPVPCHRAIGQQAAVLVLTADEESDARNAQLLLDRTVDRLIRLYAQYDANAGEGLRHAMLQAYGAWQGDEL